MSVSDNRRAARIAHRRRQHPLGLEAGLEKSTAYHDVHEYGVVVPRHEVLGEHGHVHRIRAPHVSELTDAELVAVGRNPGGPRAHLDEYGLPPLDALPDDELSAFDGAGDLRDEEGAA